MRLGRSRDRLARVLLPADPQRLEVGHGPAAAQVPEMGPPSEHRGQRRHRLLLHGGRGASAVEGMVVRVDGHRQGVGEPRGRVRRLEHLADVEGVPVRVVVGQPFGRLQQDGADLLLVERGCERGQRRPGAFERLEGRLERPELGPPETVRHVRRVLPIAEV
jgi:hypothetical protein